MTQNDLPKVEIYRLHHREQFRLGIFFGFDEGLKAIAKKLRATYSKTYRCWYVDDEADALERIAVAFKNRAWVDYKAIQSRLSDEHRKQYATQFHGQKTGTLKAATPEVSRAERKIIVPKEYRNLLERRRYSANTVKTYVSMFTVFLSDHAGRQADEISEEQIKAYMNRLVKEKRVSQSTHNQMINSIKFYYEQVLGLEKKKYWIDRPRKEEKLPKVISEEDVIRLIAGANNLKHQCMIAMIYATGMRRGELIRLRLEDIDTARGQVFIRGGKGKKDRTTIWSDAMNKAYAAYLTTYKPNYWVFEGPNRSQYTDRSVGAVIRQAGQRAGIKGVTAHVLRHSFATHLMDHGTDTRVIQTLLGHERLETTAIYTHVSTKNLQKITNPLDRIISQNADRKRLLEDGDEKK
ncbi:MAG: tyrosine-type recombinase/integrase [Flavobacteriales bacterium]